ncbi:MAG: hypothetical protein H7249_10830 [Chitinophagaceae bacterium]|nr:hypothetical protein [Oligoflexus sp.]
MNVLREFGFQYLGVGAVVTLLFLLGAFTIVAICLQESRLEPIQIGPAFKSAVRTLFPHGLLFLFVALLGSLLLLNVAVQIVPGSFIRFLGMVMCVLISAMPVLMTLDTRHPWKAFKMALGLDYVGFTGMSKWSVFFLLLTYELLALNVVALFEWLGSYLEEIDSTLNIGRSAVFSVSPQFPFGKLIWLTEAIYSVGFALTTVAFLVLNVTFMYELYRRNTVGRTISIIT